MIERIAIAGVSVSPEERAMMCVLSCCALEREKRVGVKFLCVMLVTSSHSLSDLRFARAFKKHMRFALSCASPFQFQQRATGTYGRRAEI